MVGVTDLSYEGWCGCHTQHNTYTNFHSWITAIFNQISHKRFCESRAERGSYIDNWVLCESLASRGSHINNWVLGDWKSL